MKIRSRNLIWMIATLMMSSLSISLRAQAPDPEKVARIKSAYLLNFLKFSEWPSSSFENETSPLVITIVGRHAMDNTVESLVSNELIGNRRVQIRRLDFPAVLDSGRPRDEDLTEFMDKLKKSHLVYIDAGERTHIPRILKGLKGLNILTVSDAPGFCEQGGMLALPLRNNHIALDANPDEIGQTQVKVSSKVLRLARIVETSEQNQ
jgi:hypothetical protein